MWSQSGYWSQLWSRSRAALSWWCAALHSLWRRLEESPAANHSPDCRAQLWGCSDRGVLWTEFCRLRSRGLNSVDWGLMWVRRSLGRTDGCFSRCPSSCYWNWNKWRQWRQWWCRPVAQWVRKWHCRWVDCSLSGATVLSSDTSVAWPGLVWHIYRVKCALRSVQATTLTMAQIEQPICPGSPLVSLRWS